MDLEIKSIDATAIFIPLRDLECVELKRQARLLEFAVAKICSLATVQYGNEIEKRCDAI